MILLPGNMSCLKRGKLSNRFSNLILSGGLVGRCFVFPSAFIFQEVKHSGIEI